METPKTRRSRSRRENPRAARLLFEDPAGTLRVELFEAGGRSRVRADCRDRDSAERFLAALKRETMRERYGFVEPELGATDTGSPRRHVVSAAVSPASGDLEPAAQFLGGFAAGVAVSRPAHDPRRLPAS